MTKTIEKFEPKNIAFLNIENARGGYFFGFKESDTDWFKHNLSNIRRVPIFISLSNLKRKIENRLMGVTPMVASGYDVDFIQRYAGHPKGNFGIYYKPDCLLLLDDIIEWGDSHRKITEIRSAKQINEYFLTND